jgi:amino acid transporter
MVDHVLNVAVGISAGVAALVSAVPALHAYTLPLCLGILVLLTFVNLRGTMDAGRMFALPTYLRLIPLFAIGAFLTFTHIAKGHGSALATRAWNSSHAGAPVGLHPSLHQCRWRSDNNNGACSDRGSQIRGGADGSRSSPIPVASSVTGGNIF